MSVAQIFFAVADLLETHTWGQGAYARDREGNQVSARDGSASCFCFVGAIIHVCPSSGDGYTDAVALGYQVVGDTLINWNDEPSRTKADVVAMARAIGRKAEKEGR